LAAPTAVLADVTVYGKLHVSADYIDSDTADTATQDAANLSFSSNSSRIGFKGNEDLVRGLKAVWQVESGVNMGATGHNGTSTGTNNTLSSRNSFLGLKGGFGTVLIGNHDTPFKMFGRNFDVFGDTVADNRQLFNTATDGIGWDLRPSNVLAYITPDLKGFGGVVAYVSDAAPASGSADNNNASAFSLNGTYSNGPIYVGAAYEVHIVKSSALGTGFTNDPYAFRLGGSFKAGPVKVGAMYQALRDADGIDAERDDFTLFGTFSFGMETIKLAYTYAGELEGTVAGTGNNTDAGLFALGFDHKFSKRTTAYAQLTMVNNEAIGNYGLGANSGYGNPIAATSAGENPSAFSVGLIHSF
jgi:predicted porin